MGVCKNLYNLVTLDTQRGKKNGSGEEEDSTRCLGLIERNLPHIERCLGLTELILLTRKLLTGVY